MQHITLVNNSNRNTILPYEGHFISSKTLCKKNNGMLKPKINC